MKIVFWAFIQHRVKMREKHHVSLEPTWTALGETL